MTLVILWTDALVYTLLFFLIILGYKISGNKYTREKWRRICYRPLNMVAIIVLLTYATIGLLDTIHIKNNTHLTPSGIESVLDEILSPLILHHERSYSAPFATKAFTKETETLPNGEIVRDYPRLKFGGAHLKDPNQAWPDIRFRLLQIIAQTALIWLACSIVLIMFASWRHCLSWEKFSKKVLAGETHFPWRTFLGTLAVLLFIILAIRGLMPYYHIFGTNQIGEDVLYHSLKSIRTGLIIGTVTTLLTLPFAILFGLVAGYFRGWIDDVIQYLYTTLSSIPGVLLIAAAVLILQVMMSKHTDWFQTVVERSDARLLALCAILGITTWTGLCRLLRGEALKISEMDYVQAAHVLGTSHFKILYSHFLPNVSHIILITLTLEFSGLVLAEAVLSYVGVGVDPASYSWGTMINGARLEMARLPVVWWTLAAAFSFMSLLVLSANIFSDAMRDVLDPRTHGSEAVE